MSKRFNGIATAKDLGQDIGSNSSVLENAKGVLYALNINSVVYYDKNLNQLDSNEAPTKKYVAPLMSSPTTTYGDNQTVKYIDISIGSSKELQVEDWITIITSSGKYYICNPADSNFIFTYNNLKYFLWKYYALNGSQASSWTVNGEAHVYFITSIAEYNVLQSCIGNPLSYYVIAEFDATKNEVGKFITNNTILNVLHFPGLYFKSIGTTTISMVHDGGYIVNTPNIQYSLNYGLTWSPSNEQWDGTSINLDDGHIVWFKGSNNLNGFNYVYWRPTSQTTHELTYVYSYFNINGSGTVKAYGSIMSLIDGIGESLTIPSGGYAGGCFHRLFFGCGNKLVKAPKLPATTLTGYCYYSMFAGCTALTEAPALPATTLADSCYYNMFYNCTSLTLAPELPATTLANSCYWKMFYNCTSLTLVPNILPATTLTLNCYCMMFYGCSGLIIAPELPATTLNEYCYNGMFLYCNRLTLAPALPATTLANSCYTMMFYNCNSLTLAPALPATTLASNCYNSMFLHCTSLTLAPALPATTLADCDSCYSNMFGYCTSLANAPELPATTLADKCYLYMFEYCTSLANAPELPATTLATRCYEYMFKKCTSLISAPKLPATSLVNQCYLFMFDQCKNLDYVYCMALSNITTTNCESWLNDVAPRGTFIYAYGNPSWTRNSISGIPTEWDSTVPAMAMQTTTFMSIHILLDPEIANPSLTIKIQKKGSNHTIQYSKTVGNWSTGQEGYEITITGTEVLNLKGVLSAANTSIDYTNILITSSNGTKAMLTGNCAALWSATPAASSVLKDYCGYKLFYGSTAIKSILKEFLICGSPSPYCYYSMFENCTSLTYAPNINATVADVYSFYRMFYGCTSLENTPELYITTVANHCCEYMFHGCTSLIKVPSKLPATDLSNTSHCYSRMFNGCSKLEVGPELPALSLGQDCYSAMFENCTSLKVSPALPATTLAASCYKLMFMGCINLTSAPILPADTMVNYCYHFMFYGCIQLNKIYCAATNINTDYSLYWLEGTSGIGTFYKMSTTWPTNNTSGIPSGWTSYVHNIVISENNCIEIRLLTTSGATITFTKISSNLTLQYKDFNHNLWTNINEGDSISLNSSINPVVLLKGDLSAANFTTNYTLITITKIVSESSAQVVLLGNCNYLWNSSFNEPLKNYCGYRLFYGSTAIAKVSKNFLPSTTLASNCYQNMFSGCTSLTLAPALPATTLANYCYLLMFLNCSSLTSAPALPVTTLANYCYLLMFLNCSSLTSAPELPATNLTYDCYNRMFSGCTSLTLAPALPATALANHCYYLMFLNCSSLTSAPELPATNLTYNCYNSMFSGCTSLTLAPALPAVSLDESCYQSMFENCTSLTLAPALPATALANHCYYLMFLHCTSLTLAPALPATNLIYDCYSNMFHGCTSLTLAPALPAVSLDESCYQSMFENCTSLTLAPALPATKLEYKCYEAMFYDCTSLTLAPVLPATKLEDYCYNYIFGECSNLIEIICFATDLTAASTALNNWLLNTNGGIVYCKNININVPSNWAKQLF